jgi:hypothetical protein
MEIPRIVLKDVQSERLGQVHSGREESGKKDDE